MTAGLDVRALQGLRASRRDLDLIRCRIRAHLDRHEGYVAFSGGKDSLVVLDLVRQVAPETPVAFFDSGLEFPETYAYLDGLAIRADFALDFRRVGRAGVSGSDRADLRGEWQLKPTHLNGAGRWVGHAEAVAIDGGLGEG